MPRFFLSPYTVRIRDKQTDSYLPLGTLGSGHGLFSLFHEYLSDRKANFWLDSSSQKLLRVRQFRHQDTTIGGLVETGEYGYEADLYNLEAAAVSYQRTASDAEMGALLLFGQFACQTR